MCSAAAFIEALRSYKGLPFRHQGRDRCGVDCVGLAICALRDCGIAVGDHLGYRRIPDGERLKNTLTALFDEVEPFDARPGDCLLFRMEGQVCHVGFVTGTEPLSIVHSKWGAGVIEHRVDPPLRACVIAAYRHPEVV